MVNNIHISLLINSILLISIIAIPSTIALTQNNDHNLITLTLNFEKPFIERLNIGDQSIARIRIKDTETFSSYGKPVLPVKPVTILLPPSTEVKNIIVEPLRTKKLIDFSLLNLELGKRSKNFEDFSYESTFSIIPLYDQTRLFPQTIFENIGIQYRNGFSLLYLNLYPVRYLYNQYSLDYYEQIKITIETESNGNTNPFFKCDNLIISEIQNMVDNPELIQLYKQQLPTLNLNEGNNIDYIIITTEDLKNPIEPGEYTFDDLISFRQSQGLNCSIKTVEEIQLEYTGADLPEKIRNFIKYAYSNWNTKWIMIGGDVEKVPIRYLRDIDGVSNEGNVASDLYYQCLDGTYNFDQDEIWGEEFDGEYGQRIDLLAEVYIGRAPVDDSTDVSAFVEKTLVYESLEWDNDPYLHRVLSAGEKLWSGVGGYGAGYAERCIDFCTDYSQETYGIPSNQFDIVELYERDISWEDSDVISEIDQGFNIINHIGHGTSIAAMKLSIYELQLLNNEGKYGLFYSQACHSGQLEITDECIAERWVNIPKKGGFAAIMNTGFGYGSTEDYDGPDNRFAREFFDALFSPNEKISRIGKANQDSKEDNIWRINEDNMYHVYYNTILFGDPYVEIKGSESTTAEFTWNPHYPITGNPISFQDTSTGLISYRKWEFGDGYISHEKNPTHAYISDGIYTVTLMVQDRFGYMSTKSKTIKVEDEWNPIAIASPSYYNGYNFTIHFYAEESFDPDGNIIQYTWKFMDGEISHEINPIHTFIDEGTYNVELAVEDNDGNFAKTYCKIIISLQFPPYKPILQDGPTSVLSGNSYNYTVVATDVEENDIQYGWDWGDGSNIEWTDWYLSGEECTIQHAWFEIGEHRIKVKARDINYAESEWSDEIIAFCVDNQDPLIEIITPNKGIYFSNKLIVPFFTTIVIGEISIEISATDSSGIEKVLFYIDNQDQPVAEALSPPYKFTWSERSFKKHDIRIVVYDNAGRQNMEDIIIWKFF